MIIGESLIYSGCLIYREAEDKYYIDMEEHGEHYAKSYKEAKTLIASTKRGRA